MRIVLQKVSEGLVDVVDEVSGEVDATFEPQRIGVGYVLLVGVEDEDGTKQVDWLFQRLHTFWRSYIRVALTKSPTCAFSKTRTAK